ncbi:efflux RND transporter periplasmic adaptor subunit [Bacteroides helcogenes]|uniref:Efflux transporter, RND family, MFP subunit n=1 Tax=Bacteroides helcogenes (strain ATCC 35417 / DSM 20613 / JCM 6297 / CCUG 15421 / P 36-108) TaxID=693979 RepID=E6SRN5_BACT6|nr:HlyD family efflux transporter periplasmic adaptor subunit [Bacteroides helcogenes]ADV45125.1 efflux transporter, RND family, MFP subunit [Bacteroides helcogenes P 36-108]MDY5238684.1 efflux RND transporter periplasmic adaptor subunit [Bacteroides helcogenes]
MKAITFLLVSALLTGCTHNTPNGQQTESESRTSVTLTHVSLGNIKSEIVLSGTTVYLRKSVIAAPISAFISNTEVQPGSIVNKGQTLYTLETKESRALAGSVQTRNNALTGDTQAGNATDESARTTERMTSHTIPVKAGASGIVTSVTQQPGSYVIEGGTLCEMADLSSLVFQLNVPYEQLKIVTQSGRCTIILPDDTRLAATVQKPLATMNATSQVQQVIATARAPFLPEGLVVKVLVETETSGRQGMILPKSAVQSDETQEHQWVMKLLDDSTAVKIPLTTGHSNADSIEVSAAGLSPKDRIILTGGYALENKSRVVVTK